ncbi:23S rRNA (guanosine(2251)-2'-O)-methyltransferase RlmB [Hydrogenimonas urashimensis]|uniref:23S rRNA (guanosine(2251)-2'-O)-methyltransferase RlmB n=1 Tax=Hydrogenimonas urashimensis TaxID=2740515 RepID=UPI001915B808|nr:23S rRNA (guanosine(2251)-2'-O)-methyltransferase RlmB [Hydrogenimonas urashimensis]
MIVYGKQICKFLIERHPELINRFLLAKEIDKKDFGKISGIGKPIERVDAKKAQALARGGNHQGWLCDIKPYRYSGIAPLKKMAFLVVLAGLTDVGNIGAIIRTAYALGADGVVAAGVGQLQSEAVVRASAGAMFDLPVAIAPNLLDLLNELKQSGFTLYGAGLGGQSIETVEVAPRRVLVLGSEGSGIPKRALEKMDKIVTIEMARPFDSLNVSAAAAILIYRMGHA